MKKYYKPYLLLGALIIVYALLTFSIPPDPANLARYNISPTQSRLLSLTIVLPAALTWVAAFYGFSRFSDYADSIRKTADGKAVRHVVKGLRILAYGLPLSSIVSTVNTLLTRQDPGYQSTGVIINHYTSIVISLTAFWFIYKGGRKLMQITKAKPDPRHWMLMSVGFASMVFTYAYLIFSNPARNNASLADGRSIFYLPDWLILTTIIMPYLAVWFMGLASGLYISTYRNKVKGLIYRQAFRFLAWGMFGVIGSLIFRQYLTAASNLLTNLSLAPLLIIVYFLLLFIALGYVLIAYGARKLKQIEEV